MLHYRYIIVSGIAKFLEVHYNGIMKIVLTTLNAKYIHSALSLWTLKAFCADRYPAIELAEYAVNEPLERIIGSLVQKKPDLLGFSCYIWNMTETLQIAETIKKILPACTILLGGPEVSYDGEAQMTAFPFIDFIIIGEGESVFLHLLEALSHSMDMNRVNGLIWRQAENIVSNARNQDIPHLDDIPFVYKYGFSNVLNKILYYETSRGCPYHCQYCLSSVTAGVRFLSMERIRQDIKTFVDAGIPQVKLVDRTFNCQIERAKEIFKLILSLGGDTNFHMELAGDRIDEEMLQILKDAPPGKFQFEIGIQSVNKETLAAVARNTQMDHLKSHVTQLLKTGNIHIHLDLIAGLPMEGYDSFAQSFNEALSLRPHRLQLGFLKLLKGSGLRKNAAEYAYEFTSYPPYEVISNKYIQYDELWRLKRIEELLELFYNSGRFSQTIEYLIQVHQENAFYFFEHFMAYWTDRGYDKVSHSLSKQYELILAYGESLPEVSSRRLKDLLLYDYLCREKPERVPKIFLSHATETRVEALQDFLQSDAQIKKIIPHLSNLPVKQISRHIHVQAFSYNVLDWRRENEENPIRLLFDYSGAKPPLYKAEVSVL